MMRVGQTVQSGRMIKLGMMTSYAARTTRRWVVGGDFSYTAAVCVARDDAFDSCGTVGEGGYGGHPDQAVRR
jgi:hypothetical protein